MDGSWDTSSLPSPPWPGRRRCSSSSSIPHRQKAARSSCCLNRRRRIPLDHQDFDILPPPPKYPKLFPFQIEPHQIRHLPPLQQQPPPPSPSATGSPTPPSPPSTPPVASRRSPSPTSPRVGKPSSLLSPEPSPPTCSQKHLPGFVEKAADLKAKGVDPIACVSVNDAFVIKAWKESLNVWGDDDVLMLSDANGYFTRALGVGLALSDKPGSLGVRSRRYALLEDDGVVKVLKLEEGGAFTFSSAEDMLKAPLKE